jgi:hypothetical protein
MGPSSGEGGRLGLFGKASRAVRHTMMDGMKERDLTPEFKTLNAVRGCGYCGAPRGPGGLGASLPLLGLPVVPRM